MESSRAILKNMRENDNIDKIKLLWQTTSDLRHKDLRDISSKGEGKIKENFIKFIVFGGHPTHCPWEKRW